VDPGIVDRGLRGHRKTQNALARYLRAQGYSPRRAAPGEPQFDLAWEDHRAIVVAEVKSRTVTNEEKQLRLGLGQVLRYQQQLAAKGRPVRAVLVLEGEPRDPSWRALCSGLGVVLTWPETFSTTV